MAFTALLDANVLYSAPLRDLLLQIAVAKLFRARWSDAIHDEWIRAATRAKPDTPSTKWAALRSLMDAHVEDCLVIGFEPLIDPYPFQTRTTGTSSRPQSKAVRM